MKTVLEKLAVGCQAGGEPLEGLDTRPCLAPLDLADVLLRKAIAGQLRLAHPGRTTERAETRPDRPRRQPVGALVNRIRLFHHGSPTSLDSRATSERASRAFVPTHQKVHHSNADFTFACTR